MNADQPVDVQVSLQPRHNALRRFNKRFTNRFMMLFAGRRIYAVVHHRGRKSGAAYQTPVVAAPFGDAFYFPLPYSERADWCQNVLAAGECELQFKGRRYALKDPALLSPTQALPAFPRWMRGLLGQTHIYLRLRRAAPPLDQPIRSILVIGAGVLGSLYAGRLHQAGYAVTLLARGRRLQELRERGLALVEDGTGRTDQIALPVTDQLAPAARYDLTLVVVRKNQLPGVLPWLAGHAGTPAVLFLVNNAQGPEPLFHALGRERVLLGFPGAGGQRENGVVHYRVVPGRAQQTTIGEPDGHPSVRLRNSARAFEDAGFPVAISSNMDAWLKTHVALVSPIANALYLAGGSCYRLARTRDGLALLVRAVKEGLAVLRALHIPITPARFWALAWLPEPLLVAALRSGLATPQAELVLARHANAARDEMTQLAHEFGQLARQSGLRTPAIDSLAAYLDPDQPPLPEGQAEIPLNWRSTIAAGALAAVGLAAVLLLRRRRR